MGKVHYTPEQVAVNKANAAPYKERRLALGFSQKQLAQKAGVDESAYRRMELGQSVPIWETRQKNPARVGDAGRTGFHYGRTQRDFS